MKQTVVVVLVAGLLCIVAGKLDGNGIKDQDKAKFLECWCQPNKSPADRNGCITEMMPQYPEVVVSVYTNWDCSDKTPLAKNDQAMPGSEQTNNTVPIVPTSSSTVPDSTSNPGRAIESTTANQTVNANAVNGSVTESFKDMKSSTDGAPIEGGSSTGTSPTLDESSPTEVKASTIEPVLTSDPAPIDSGTTPNSNSITEKPKSSDAVDEGSDHLAWSIPLIAILLIAMCVGGYFIFRHTKKAGYLQQTGKSINGDSTKKTTEPV